MNDRIKEDRIMITLRPAQERGRTLTGWLDSSHTFSFNRYYDPRWSGFRNLLVLNEDLVAPGSGFPTHSHSDMEILSYVLSGELAHKDSTGVNSVIRPHEFQKMSAGAGVSHSEFNPSDAEPTHFLQIWIEPDQEGLKTNYEQKRFPPEERRGKLRLIASRDGAEGSITVHQDVRVYNALLAPGDKIRYPLGEDRYAWVQLVSGGVALDGAALSAGDGAAIMQEHSLEIIASDIAELLLFDLV
jgi:redox-sensitive bicupin YhaK (pirin superfamily)